jgi:hypothetical protein
MYPAEPPCPADGHDTPWSWRVCRACAFNAATVRSYRPVYPVETADTVMHYAPPPSAAVAYKTIRPAPSREARLPLRRSPAGAWANY